MTTAEIERYLTTPRGQIEFQLWTFSWPEKIQWWVAWHLPRKIALLAMVRVAAASGKGPDELTYDVMCEDWEKGKGR